MPNQADPKYWERIFVDQLGATRMKMVRAWAAKIASWVRDEAGDAPVVVADAEEPPPQEPTRRSAEPVDELTAFLAPPIPRTGRESPTDYRKSAKHYVVVLSPTRKHFARWCKEHRTTDLDPRVVWVPSNRLLSPMPDPKKTLQVVHANPLMSTMVAEWLAQFVADRLPVQE